MGASSGAAKTFTADKGSPATTAKRKATKTASSANTATVTARVPREVKRRAELEFKKAGVTPTQAINYLYKLTYERGEFPWDVIPKPHALPKPGARVLNKEAIERFKTGTKDEVARWEAFERHMKFKVTDWGEDADRPYKEIIAEGRLRDYEALSRH